MPLHPIDNPVINQPRGWHRVMLSRIEGLEKYNNYSVLCSGVPCPHCGKDIRVALVFLFGSRIALSGEVHGWPTLVRRAKLLELRITTVQMYNDT